MIKYCFVKHVNDTIKHCLNLEDREIAYQYHIREQLQLSIYNYSKHSQIRPCGLGTRRQKLSN